MRRRSMKGLSISIMALFVLPAIALLLLLFSYTLEKNDEYTRGTLENVLTVSVRAMDQRLTQAKEAADRLLDSYDWLIFANTSQRREASQRASRLVSSLQEKLQSNSALAGVLLYNQKSDYFYPAYQRVFPLAEQGRAKELISGGENTSQSGFVHLDTAEGITLLYAAHRDWGTLALLLDVRVDLEAEELTRLEENAQVAYAFGEFAQSDLKDIHAASGIIPELVLTFHQPSGALLSRMDGTQRMLLLAMVLLLCAAAGVIVHAWRQLMRPIAVIEEGMNRVREGDMSYRIALSGGTAELRHFADTFNEMMDTINRLEAERAEKERLASQAQMQYLQIQIRPHFYLNCLKNLYALVNQGDIAGAQEMILALSGYLRFIFRDNTELIPLAREIEACDQYVKLCRLLGSDISLQMRIGADCSAALVLPLSLLTFLENSIKHAQKAQGLHLRLAARAEGDTLQMMIADDGGGFPPDRLAQLNGRIAEQGAGRSGAELPYREEHIGIANVRYRLRLKYGDAAAVLFENRQGGACVRITQPLQKGDGVV